MIIDRSTLRSGTSWYLWSWCREVEEIIYHRNSDVVRAISVSPSHDLTGLRLKMLLLFRQKCFTVFPSVAAMLTHVYIARGIHAWDLAAIERLAWIVRRTFSIGGAPAPLVVGISVHSRSC